MIQIRFFLPEGRDLTGVSSPDDTLREAFMSICRKTESEESEVCFRVDGRSVYSTDKIKDISQATDIFAFVSKRLNGGGFPFNKLNAVEKRNFAKTGPSRMTAHPGLSWIVKCLNPECEAYQESVCCNSTFGKFNVAKKRRELTCPICKEKASIGMNLLFSNCNWSFRGWPRDSDQERTGSGKADTDHYYTFKEGDDIEWEWLKVEVSPL
mmetsp:Transcript_4882/g.9136  ORF Transcript_4882/g.9136 Transcript_4882/m.9136 type:complete len:210 (-) Transcript_4882:23-652(-)